MVVNLLGGGEDAPIKITWNEWILLTPEEQSSIHKAIITNVPGASGTIDVDFIKTLWTNSSPTAAFAAQIVTLASDDYDFLMFEYKISTTDQRHMTTIVKKGESARMYTVAPSSDYPVVLLTRDASYVSNVSYSVSTASATIGSAYQTNDIFLLPLAIYGFKKNIEFDLTAVVADVSTSADKCMLSDGETSVEDIIGRGSVSIPISSSQTWATVLSNIKAVMDPSKLRYSSCMVCNNTVYQISDLGGYGTFVNTRGYTDSDCYTLTFDFSTPYVVLYGISAGKSILTNTACGINGTLTIYY